MNTISFYFLMFFIFSFIGYLIEVIDYLVTDHILVNRGYLIGPYIPLYGVGGVLIFVLLSGYYNDPFVVYIMGLIICSIIEYITSYLLEKIFHNKWWDYSYRKYHINGRVCLINSILFGVLALLIVYLVGPVVSYFLSNLKVSSLNLMALGLFIIMFIDFIISTIEAVRVNNVSKHLETILNEYTKNKNLKINRIKTRLLEAFPFLVNNQKLVKKLKLLKKDFSKK